MPVTIRAVRFDEIPQLAQLGCQSYIDHYAELWHVAGLEQFLLRSFSRAKLRREFRHFGIQYFFVLDETERPVGFAKLKLHRSAPGHRQLDAALLDKIYFLKDAAGRGYGTLLLHFVCEHSQQLGKALLWLDVLKSNVDGQRFYERWGFEKYREISFATDRLEVGMWLMKKHL